MSVNIKLDETVRLESDSVQYMLKEYKGKQDKKGNEIYNVIGYYGTINRALKDYLSFTTKKSNCTSIGELIAYYEKLEKHIDTLVKGEI